MNAEYRGLSPLNILLAEDERAVAFSIVFALKLDGHNVQIVADGWQALASINVEPDRFGLLITDHSMPGMTGLELIQRLREESPRSQVALGNAHCSGNWTARAKHSFGARLPFPSTTWERGTAPAFAQGYGVPDEYDSRGTAPLTQERDRPGPG